MDKETAEALILGLVRVCFLGEQYGFSPTDRANAQELIEEVLQYLDRERKTRNG